MTLSIYDTSRVRFASGSMSWITDNFSAVIPKLGYVPDFRNHTTVSQIQPLRGPEAIIQGRALDAGGWFISQEVFFGSSPINEMVDRIVILRTSDNVLLLHIDFQSFISPTGKPFRLIRGLSRPGFCRL